jgi:hypothetical protein
METLESWVAILSAGMGLGLGGVVVVVVVVVGGGGGVVGSSWVS